MTDLTIKDDLNPLDKSIYIAKYISTAIDVLRPLVYQVWTEKLWEGRFSSFGEYVESPEGLNRSQGYASKLKQVQEHYVIEGGLSEKDISGVDYESLYLALKTAGTPREQLSKAKTLTRSELKAERQDFVPCAHVNQGNCCFDCWMKL